MIHHDLKNKFEFYRLLGLEDNINYFNWSFLNNKAIVRRETSNWIYHKSDLVEYFFDREKNILTNPKTLYTDKFTSYEDPRIISEKDLSYVKVERKLYKDNFLPKAGDFIYSLMYNNIDCNIQYKKGYNSEKNWQFESLNNFIYSINPFIIYNDNKFINKGNFILSDFKYGNEYYLSTNKFVIDNREFIFFHTKNYINHNFLHYYQGVIELKNNKPFSYSKEPFFYPSDYLSDKSKLCQLFRFREISESILYRYQLAYFTTARVENNKLNISCGLNECESVMISIDNNKFIEWYDTYLQVF